ncbi:hypothetical protein [Paraclostridium bifermentans]|uniref:hypothetical protein n=1 Tax=Paraclostridium bifermentans TaxID=1490 RepID=UPI00374E6B95
MLWDKYIEDINNIDLTEDNYIYVSSSLYLYTNLSRKEYEFILRSIDKSSLSNLLKKCDSREKYKFIVNTYCRALVSNLTKDMIIRKLPNEDYMDFVNYFNYLLSVCIYPKYVTNKAIFIDEILKTVI